jgi:hypothetical protein
LQDLAPCGRKQENCSAQEQLEQLGFDLIESIADKNYALAGQMTKEFEQYVSPKRKAIEHTTDEPTEVPQITINITDDSKPFPNSPAVKIV